MFNILYTSTLTMTFLFTSVTHPLSMGLILLIQVTLIASMSGLLTYNFWFSYILFMIMIGGMLVLFIYMTSVASNEKFLYSNKISMLIMFMMIMMTSSFIIDSTINHQSINNTDLFQLNNAVMFSTSLNKYFNFPTNWIMISMIIYLLITLIAVVKITNITYGPLRQKI
uniref:NADH dehydrogenase subunit 6 n=1 Tax=Athousius wudanganus TaxID=1028072 RepID=UPI002E76A135|nr:NADH dehydrogenase subunit 6 [Athousius wudanganus]UBS91007.1 NADH dehydrogenase subunit 6 [Athousius wudanganus]